MKNLQNSDPIIHNSILRELNRQKHQIELIASENIVSRAILEANGSVFTNKYAEGYPGKRYYGGCRYADEVEAEGIKRACELFGAKFANIQPHSGSTANEAVFLAFLKPGDTIMGMSLASGGHLTHGAPPSISGKWFNAIPYDVNQETGWLDYDKVEELALKNKPKLIIAGVSSYSRIVDWKRFREIADKVGAIFMVDMAHIAGLVAGGVYPSPVPFADVVTSTSHKTLRSTRGGFILTNSEEHIKKINSAVFPGMISGPLMHSITAKAVGFGEALRPDFKIYAKNVVENAKTLSKTLMDRGINIATGGTDSHLMVADVSAIEGDISGKEAENILEEVWITCNKNVVPNEKKSPFVTSGIRLGTSACTTRGFGAKEFTIVGNLIADTLYNYAKNKSLEEGFVKETQAKVLDLCNKFPIYQDL